MYASFHNMWHEGDCERELDSESTKVKAVLQDILADLKVFFTLYR